MDVYEHIAIEDRPGLHEALTDLLRDQSRIFLSFPTPRHQTWLRQYHPDQIQPVDEDVSIDTISALARDTRTEVVFYQEVGVWHDGDYAHGVLEKRGAGWPSLRTIRPMMGFEGFANCCPGEMNPWFRKDQKGLIWSTGTSAQSFIRVSTPEHRVPQTKAP